VRCIMGILRSQSGDRGAAPYRRRLGNSVPSSSSSSSSSNASCFPRLGNSHLLGLVRWKLQLSGPQVVTDCPQDRRPARTRIFRTTSLCPPPNRRRGRSIWAGEYPDVYHLSSYPQGTPGTEPGASPGAALWCSRSMQRSILGPAPISFQRLLSCFPANKRSLSL
jgi:hypothetical protein